jgi:hypothetical protein
MIYAVGDECYCAFLDQPSQTRWYARHAPFGVYETDYSG